VIRGLAAGTALSMLVTGAWSILAAAAIFTSIPLNKSNVSDGMVPGIPGIAYHFDEGRLSLYEVDEEGHRELIFEGQPSAGGYYRDEAGNIIGGLQDDGEGAIFDPVGLAVLVAAAEAKRKKKEKEKMPPEMIEAALKAYRDYADEVAKNQPRLCPDPSRDPGRNDSYQAGLYQLENCKLPPNWGVLFNGVRYDGCDPPTGILKECKALGFDHQMSRRSPEFLPHFQGLPDILDQIEKQNRAAGDRVVIWHVAEPRFASFLAAYAAQNGLYPIVVMHTPASAAVQAKWRKMEEEGYLA